LYLFDPEDLAEIREKKTLLTSRRKAHLEERAKRVSIQDLLTSTDAAEVRAKLTEMGVVDLPGTAQA
jgi:hypothetical protein